MTVLTSTASPGLADDAGPAPAGRRRRRRLVVAVPLAVLLAAGVTVAATDPFDDDPSASTADAATAGSLATVEQRSLTAQTEVNGTLGHAGAIDVMNQLHGTITALPTVGQVVNQGEVLYRVDGVPVVLLLGSVPAYRDLAAGAAASDVTGADVQQLNADLVALGYATASELDPASDQFSWRTKRALKKLQAALGVEQTGVLRLGEAIFLPYPVQITSLTGALGAPAQPGGAVLEAASTTPVVTVALTPARQSEVKPGDAVSVVLPNNTTTPGTVFSVGTVATKADPKSDDDPTIAVTIALTDPAGVAGLDQAPVQVSITTAKVDDALVVPVTALLALASGGYAVEVVDDAGGHRLVAVTTGLFDSGQGSVAVTGDGLQAGQRVVVPSS
jgi:hypothetical protein